MRIFLAYVFALTASALKVNLRDSPPLAARRSLFCFTYWAGDEGFHGDHKANLPEVKQQLAKCDGHMIFTRKSQKPLYHDMVTVNHNHAHCHQKHCNLIEVMPAWTYLLENGIAQKYDYILHSELDHFVRPSKVREAIDAHVKNLDLTDDKPWSIAFGNAFVFNKQVAIQLKNKLSVLRSTWPSGCPNLELWGAASWKNIRARDGSCEQDMLYMDMVEKLIPGQFVGAAGCGRFVPFGGDEYPILCWDFFGSSVEAQRQAIRQIAFNPDSMFQERWSPQKAMERDLEETGGEDARMPGKNIPILHHVKDPEVMKLARELLGL